MKSLDVFKCVLTRVFSKELLSNYEEIMDKASTLLISNSEGRELKTVYLRQSDEFVKAQLS